jgi:integrase
MDNWEQELGRYERQVAARTVGRQLRIRMGRLRRLAQDMGDTPRDVSCERFEAWAASLPCTVATAGEYVKAARSFYLWAIAEGVAERSPVQSVHDAGLYPLHARWADAAVSFERAQLAAGIAPSTIRRRLQHLRRFAATIDAQPWHVRPEDYGAWIMQHPAARQASARDSLRAFYRWAHRAGRIETDPTAEPNRRAHRLGVPVAWAGELAAWRRWMIAGGAATASVQLRIAQLESFARAHASARPFDLTTDDVFDYLAGKQWGRETRRGFRVAVRAFYRWAVETGRAAANPTELMPRVKTAEPNRRPATDAEYFTALQSVTDDRWRLALRLSCELGMRRGEVAQAHARDLQRNDRGEAWLTVHGKGSKVRRLPVPSNLTAAIERAGDGYLFPTQTGGHTTAAWIGKKVSRALPSGVSMHALRHTFATRAYNVNRDVFTVQRLLGHASAATTQRYVQVSDDNMRALVEAVAL